MVDEFKAELTKMGADIEAMKKELDDMKGKNKMKWPYGYPTFGDVISVLVVVLVLSLLALGWFPNWRNTGAGFGPDWDCTPVPKGDPICIKRLAK